MPIINVDEGINKKQIKIIVGVASVMLLIGTTYIFRVQIEKNLADMLWNKQKLTNVAVKLYTMAAANGNLHSQSQLAHILRGSSANYEDSISASTWQKMAAEQNDPRSMYYYGTDIIDGKTGGTPIEQGIEYIQKSINSGYSDPVVLNHNYVISNGYLKLVEPTSNGTIRADDKNLEKARAFAEKSYLNKDPNSEVVLLKIYEMAQPQNMTEEVWLNKIIELQNKKPHNNGNIALNYYRLFKLTNNQNYNNKYIEFMNKAVSDPADEKGRQFLQQQAINKQQQTKQVSEDIEPGDDLNATESTLLSTINSLKALQSRGSHQNGYISKTYYRLHKLTGNEEYKVKMLEYGRLAINDPDDTKALYVKKWIIY